MANTGSYIDIMEYIQDLPGSYPPISVKKLMQKSDPIDKKAESILLAEEIAYMFNKWNVSAQDRKRIVSMIVNIKELQ